MKRYQKFLAKLFLKNFIILFLAMELFFVGIDLMQNFKNLPPSANLQILYASNIFLSFINYTLPLSLVFAMVTTIFQLIRSNELVSLYALGASKKDVILPIFILSLFITLFYIGLNNSNFVKADMLAYNIKKTGTVSNTTENIFFKSKNDYVYIQKLDPINKIGEHIKIFKTKNTTLTHIITAKKAIFKENYWQLQDVEEIHKADINAPKAKLTYTAIKTMNALEGFKPQILNNLFHDNKLTINNAFSAINLLNNEGLKTDKIRANLYILIAFPLFAPMAILILFYPLPAQRRGSNIALLNTLYILGVLMLWGLLFTMAKISFNGALTPELGILLPLFLLLLVTLYIIYKNR